MAYHEELITGKTDASGNASIQLGPVSQYEDVWFLGYVIAECVDGSSANYRLVNPLSGAKLGGFAGQMAVVGPMLLKPQQNLSLLVNSGPPSTPITGALVGDVHADPNQLVLRPIPTAAGANVGLPSFPNIIVTGPSDLQGDVKVEGKARFKGRIPWVDWSHPDFGVSDPAGVLDSTGAIQSAIAYGAPGAMVFGPPGSWRITASLLLASGTWLNGCGQGVTTIVGNFDTPLIGTTLNGTTQTIYSNLTVTNLTLQSALGHLMQINNASRVEVQNVEGFFTTHASIREGLWLQHCQRANVSLCFVHDNNGDGIQFNHVTTGTVAANIVDGGGHADDGIDIDCDFLDSSALASSKISVTGNVVLNCSAGNGIRCEDSFYVTISANEIDGITATTGNTSGIIVNAANVGAALTQHIDVIGNVISNCVSNGITVSDDTGAGRCKHVNVEANNLDNCGQAGGANIRAGIQYSATDGLVVGNYCTSCGGADANGGGIVVFKGDRVKVSENTLNGSTFGIRMWNGSGTVVYTDVRLGPNRFVNCATSYVDAINQAGVSITGDWVGAVQAPAFSAAPAPDPTAGDVFAMAALTGAVNVANAAISIKGMRLQLIWQQDGVGGRAVAYTGANWRSGGIAAQNTGANTVTIDEATCVDGTIWRVVRLVTGQAV